MHMSVAAPAVDTDFYDQRPPENVCPLCQTTELQDVDQNVCVECERVVCPGCGEFEPNKRTKVRPGCLHM